MTNKIEFVVASDVSSRDGIGVELYHSGDLLVEVFRDDSEKRRYVTLFNSNVDLDLVEQCIQEFKDKGLWDFIDCENSN